MIHAPLAFALLAALATPASCAEPAPITSEFAPASRSQPWLNVGGFSRHFNRQAGHNENNFGLGFEYRTSPQLSYMAGSYRNSVRKSTTYAALNWQPWSLGSFKLGAALGLMNGYPAMNRGGSFFVALPMLSFEGRRFGTNVALIPSVTNVDGALVVQFKLRLTGMSRAPRR